MPNPPRILHVAHGIPSYHNSLIELARRVEAAGIDFVVASHNDLSQVLEPDGPQFVHLSADATLEQQRQHALATTTTLPLPARLFQRFGISRRYRRQSLNDTELQELVHAMKPDLLLMDMECHKAIVLAHTLSVNMVLLSRWFSVFKSGNIPPMHTLLQPNTGFIGNVHITWSWFKLRLFKAHKTLRQQLSMQQFKSVTYATNSRVDVRALAKANKLSIARISDTSHWLIPHVYTKLPVMSLTIEALEFTTPKDPRMNYVGAMVGTQNTAHPQYQTGMDLFQQFRNSRESQGNPLVYCSLSTFWKTKQDITATVIDLFRQRPDVDLVMGLGGQHSAEAWNNLPANILLLDYAPQLNILEQASAVITHGGISTINEALFYGTPVIVCSSGHVDQNGCAARVAYHGVGRCCGINPLDSSELEQHIDSILKDNNQAIAKQVLDIQQQQRRYDTEATAVSFLRNALHKDT